MNYPVFNKIAIFGVPRSGTSWLGQIFNSNPYVTFRFQPLFSYTHKSALNEYSSLNEMNSFWNEIYTTNDLFVLQKDKEIHKNYPIFNKEKESTHIIFKEVRYLNIIENMLKKDSNVKIIGMLRNPLEVLSSWKTAPKEFNPAWSFLEQWKTGSLKNLNKPEEFYGYERWKYIAYLFLMLEKTYKNFYLLKYKDLHDNTFTEISKLFLWSDLDVTEETTDFIKKSQNTHSGDANSVFRKNHKNDNWKQNLNNSVIDEILKDLNNTDLDFLLH